MVEQQQLLTYPHPYKEFQQLKTPVEVKKYIVHSGNYLITPNKILDNYISEGKNKTIQRKIFNGVKYTDFENQLIKALKEAVERENLEMPKELKKKLLKFVKNWFFSFTDADYLKFVFSGNLKVEQSLKVISLFIYFIIKRELNSICNGGRILVCIIYLDLAIWLRQYQFCKIIKIKQQKILQEEGLIYQFGRDKKFRPILVINIYEVKTRLAKKTISIEDFIRAMSYLMTGIRLNMFLNYYIENWVIIIDIKFMSVFGIPFKTLGKIFDITFYAMNCTLEKVFILNPSFSLLSVWKIVVSMMGRGTPEKIQMLKKKSFPKIFEYISQNQVEQKFGGTHANLQNYWPPVNTLDMNDYHQYQEEIVQDIGQQQQQYEGLILEEQKTSLLDQENSNLMFFDDEQESGGTKFYTIEEEDIEEMENCEIGMLPNCDIMEKTQVANQFRNEMIYLCDQQKEKLNQPLQEQQQQEEKQEQKQEKQYYYQQQQDDEFYSCKFETTQKSHADLCPIEEYHNDLAQNKRGQTGWYCCSSNNSECKIF